MGRGRRTAGADHRNWEVFITCAVTGAGETVGRHPKIPVTPKEIAEAALEAARAFADKRGPAWKGR